MKNNRKLTVSELIDIDDYTEDATFNLVWWNVKPEYVDEIYHGAVQAVIIYDRNNDDVHVRVLTENAVDENGTEIDFAFDEDDIDLLRNAAQTLGFDYADEIEAELFAEE